jgi:hypothetical protein
MPCAIRANSGEAAGDAEEDREGLAAFVQGEGLHDDGECGGEHDRPAGSLNDAKGYDPGLGEAALGGKTARCGGASEEDDAERDHLAVANGVGQAAAVGEERGERECGIAWRIDLVVSRYVEVLRRAALEDHDRHYPQASGRPRP